MMKFSWLILAVAVSLGLLSLGGCGTESRATDNDSELESSIDKYLAAPTVDFPDGPPPKKVVIEDVKVGSGPAAREGDRVKAYFRGFRYRSHDEYCYRWRPEPPAVYKRLGHESPEVGLEQGMIGMREGGRRELIVPGHLNFDYQALVYVVEVVSVEPAAQPGSSKS